ncbi:MAG: TetR/AcrR family transcriptional regulator [Spirochaetes bacterium]|nr:MAG: TetR/AcrR family transcriptional regulator [Spirochaetota bacterium]
MKSRKTDKTKGVLRDRIYAAACHEFAERGLSGARVKSIARLAHVNPALVIYHFGSKEDLYLLVIRQIFGDIEKEQLLETLKAFDLAPPERLFIAIYLVVNLFLKKRDEYVYKIIFRELSDGGRYLRKIEQEQLFSRRREIVLDIILEGIRGGFFETRYPLFVVYSIFSFVTNLVLFRQINEDTVWRDDLASEDTAAKALDYTVDFVFRELMPGKPAPTRPALPPELFRLLDEIIARN